MKALIGSTLAALFLAQACGKANDESDAKSSTASTTTAAPATTAPPTTAAPAAGGLTSCTWKHPAENNPRFQCELLFTTEVDSVSFTLPEPADASSIHAKFPDDTSSASSQSLDVNTNTGTYTLKAPGLIAPKMHAVLSFMPASYELSNVHLSACEFTATNGNEYACTFTVPGDYSLDRASFQLPAIPDSQLVGVEFVGITSAPAYSLRYEAADNTITLKEPNFGHNNKYKFTFKAKGDADPAPGSVVFSAVN